MFWGLRKTRAATRLLGLPSLSEGTASAVASALICLLGISGTSARGTSFLFRVPSRPTRSPPLVSFSLFWVARTLPRCDGARRLIPSRTRSTRATWIFLQKRRSASPLSTRRIGLRMVVCPRPLRTTVIMGWRSKIVGTRPSEQQKVKTNVAMRATLLTFVDRASATLFAAPPSLRHTPRPSPDRHT